MKIDFTRRSADLEIMDDLNCQGAVVEQTLRELDVINRWLGGNAITLNAVKQFLAQSSVTYTITDLGCGSGEMLMRIAHYALEKDKKVTLTGIDANPNTIRYARDHANHDLSIEFKTLDIFSEAFRHVTSDIMIATLFLHHIDDELLTALFSQLKLQAKVAIIVNDLHRHPLAYYSFRLISLLFSKSAMVKFDGPLSVLRGFKRRELEAILTKAGIENYTLRWKWAFRWELIIYTSK